MSFTHFFRNNKIAIALTGASSTLGIILIASGVGTVGGIMILGGVVGLGYLIYKATNV